MPPSGIAMALNVKNPEAHRLAQELADATGTSLTTAVTEALRESLATRRRRGSFELLWAEVTEIQRFVADLPDRDTRSAEEVLGYDRQGLPG
jgi:antitoxin VapB